MPCLKGHAAASAQQQRGLASAGMAWVHMPCRVTPCLPMRAATHQAPSAPPAPRCLHCRGPAGRAPPHRRVPPLCSRLRSAHPPGCLGLCSCAGMAQAVEGEPLEHQDSAGRWRAAHQHMASNKLDAALCDCFVGPPHGTPGHVVGRHARLAASEDACRQVQLVCIRLAARRHGAETAGGSCT